MNIIRLFIQIDVSTARLKNTQILSSPKFAQNITILFKLTKNLVLKKLKLIASTNQANSIYN